MAGIVRENGGIPSAEVKGPGIGATKEHCCLSMPLSEIKPLFRLIRCQRISQSLHDTESIRLDASVAPEGLLDSE